MGSSDGDTVACVPVAPSCLFSSTYFMSPPGRKKASRPKTKSGCTTCRIRRIKCDEAEPSCRQCLRGHRLCEGYPKKGRSGSILSMNPTSLANLFTSDREHRCFDFFRHRTVPQLCGSFETPFWTHLLLLATHHEPAVRQASVALGALHECFEYPHSNTTENNLKFALQQYVRAIGSVTKPNRDGGKLAADVALMTCVLFICFETLRGNHSTAVSHINSGTKIVSELQSHQITEGSLPLSNTPYVPLPILSQLFTRFDTQVTQLGFGRRKRNLCQNISTADSGFSSDIPSSFSTFDEARNSLDYIRICADQTLQTLAFSPPKKQPIASSPPVTAFPPDVISKTKHSFDLIQNVSAIRMQQWSSAFETFLKQKHELTSSEQRAAQILKLHRMMMVVHLSVDFMRLMNGELVWDDYQHEFEEIVAQAELILQLSPPSTKPSFTLDTEVVGPLVAAGFACCDGRVRRQVIALLRSGNRQECLCNSLLVALAVERVMEIEEQGLGGEIGTTKSIPRWNRVVGFQVELDSENMRAKLEYVKQREDGGMEKIVEWCEWSGLEDK